MKFIVRKYAKMIVDNRWNLKKRTREREKFTSQESLLSSTITSRRRWQSMPAGIGACFWTCWCACWVAVACSGPCHQVNWPETATHQRREYDLPIFYREYEGSFFDKSAATSSGDDWSALFPQCIFCHLELISDCLPFFFCYTHNFPHPFSFPPDFVADRAL